MSLSKANAKIAADMLGDLARDLLRKKYLGLSHMGHADTWKQLRDLGLVKWSVSNERDELTADGRKVGKFLAEGA